MDHLRINASTDIGSMIVSEAGQGHVEKLRELLKAHPDKVGVACSIAQVSPLVLSVYTRPNLNCRFSRLSERVLIWCSCGPKAEIFELSWATANQPPLLILSGAPRPGNLTHFNSIWFP